MNRKKITSILILLCIALIALIADLISKHFTVEVYENIIPGFIRFFYTRNIGAAWSIFSGNILILIIVTTIAVATIILYAIFSKSQSRLFYVSTGFIIGGALGNLFDRIVFGYVRDFIKFEFIDFPVFNVADIALTVGVILLCIFYLIVLIQEFRDNKKKKNNGNKQD
jgi:signal peptidase II